MSVSPLVTLPQSGPARLVSEILQSGDEALCKAQVPAGSPFRSCPRGPAFVPATLAIEMAAQTAAALEPAGQSPDQPNDSEPQRLLVGVRAVQLHALRLDADGEFLCRATPTSQAGALRIYRFEVSSSSGDLVAEGELSTFVGEDSSPS